MFLKQDYKKSHYFLFQDAIYQPTGCMLIGIIDFKILA